MKRSGQKKPKTVIKVEGLEIGYDKSLLKVNEFVVKNGNLVYIHGATGVGKTSFLRTISLLIKPHKGKISWGEDDVWEDGTLLKDRRHIREKRASDFSFIFQGLELFNNWTVEKNLKLPWKLKKEGVGKDRNARHDEVLNRMRLIMYRNRRVKDLSGGEQQRVAIGRALVTDPKLILADEPWNSLDYTLKDVVIDLFKDHALNDNSVVIVCHDMVIPWIAGRTQFYAVGERKKNVKYREMKQLKTCDCIDPREEEGDSIEGRLLKALILKRECKKCEGRIRLQGEW